ncbi:MAG TPA: hypothetical protein VE360_14800, partial [Pyrinomonadaceae bacterium]|nr:hypothetical protein [Pyrinomonadaceae bacterium]
MRVIVPFNLRRRLRGAFALVAVAALLSNGVSAVASGVQKKQSAASAQRLSEEQRVIHVLNRLGFGARPGDV